MRPDCCEYMFIHYATALLRPSLSLFLFLSCVHPTNLKTFSDLQTHQSIPVHIKIPNLQPCKKSQKPTKLRHELLPDVQTSHFVSFRFLSKTLSNSFSIHFLHLAFFPALHKSIPSPAPASVRFFSPVDLNKSQHCKIHIMSSGNVDMRN